MLQMDTHLSMAGVKSNSFNVKNLLDLPEPKDSCSPVPGDSAVPPLGIPQVPDMSQTASYYDADNPYTRWLQTHEHAPYPSKY